MSSQDPLTSSQQDAHNAERAAAAAVEAPKAGDGILRGEEPEEEDEDSPYELLRRSEILPHPPPRAPPSEESEGKSSVMPETMTLAAQAAESAQEVAELVGESVGTVVAHEVRSRLKPSAATGSPDAQSAAHLKKHRANVSQGGEYGKVVGAHAGRGLGAGILAMARRIGAHQCDECGAKNLYNYMKCEDSACQRDDPRLNRQAGYDLCFECYHRLTRSGGSGKDAFHPPNHHFIEHNNAIYTLKLFGVGLAALVVLRFVLRSIF